MSISDPFTFEHQALQQELAYACYLNISSVILPPPRNRNHVASYARAVNECIKNTPYINFSIRIPIYDPSIFHSRSSSISSSVSSPANLMPRIERPNDPLESSKASRAPEGELNATWEMWDVVRSICDYHPRLTLSELFFAFRNSTRAFNHTLSSTRLDSSATFKSRSSQQMGR
jgi:protein arginine N-methyltransferase 5